MTELYLILRVLCVEIRLAFKFFTLLRVPSNRLLEE